MGQVTFFGNTDMGKVRKNNEDAFIAQNIWDDNHILAVVIDGVGGYEGGEIAAGLAQELIVKYLETYSNGERLDLLKQAVIYANNEIFTARKQQQQYANMSCVLTAVIIEVAEKRINMAHVGDTRLYQFANNKLIKLSHDHSLVGYREEIGELTEEAAMKHPQRNIIGRDIGSTYLENSNTDYIETAIFPLLAHSTLLLCSDGLCDMIMSKQMIEILNQPLSITKKVNALIAAANDAGGKDNVTVVLVEAELDDDSQQIMEIAADHTDVPETAPVKQQNTIIDQQPSKDAKTKHKSRLLLWIICLVLTLLLGFITGSLWGHKVLRRDLFGTGHIDSGRYSITTHCDTLFMSLQQDTSRLRKLVKMQDELIILLEDSLSKQQL